METSFPFDPSIFKFILTVQIHQLQGKRNVIMVLNKILFFLIRQDKHFRSLMLELQHCYINQETTLEFSAYLVLLCVA